MRPKGAAVSLTGSGLVGREAGFQNMLILHGLLLTVCRTDATAVWQYHKYIIYLILFNVCMWGLGIYLFVPVETLLGNHWNKLFENSPIILHTLKTKFKAILYSSKPNVIWNTGFLQPCLRSYTLLFSRCLNMFFFLSVNRSMLAKVQLRHIYKCKCIKLKFNVKNQHKVTQSWHEMKDMILLAFYKSKFEYFPW